MERNTLHEKAASQTAFTADRAYRTRDVDVDSLKPATLDGVQLRLHGVDHTARPTWKLRETVKFYRDILGLPLVHTISARGWGQPGHPDFLHFFFDAGKGATIAFFYYIGTDRPDKFIPEDHYFYSATHTAWGVESEEELHVWKETLEKRGVTVSPYTRHEILESIYFRDPNGYPLEITLRLRDIHRLDAKDAELTLEAAMQMEDEMRAKEERLRDIDTVWRRKGKLVEDYIGAK
jgi:catechol 2,3-dioxygenase-like lactoylglutathione lyase family enzyme